jgi:hypothetical protein
LTGLITSLSGGVADKILTPSGSTGTNRDTVLRQKWTDASNNFRDAPFELSFAEKNYYHYNNGGNTAEGDVKYESAIIDRFAQTADELKKNSIEKQQEFMVDISQMLKQYQGQKLFSQRTEQLLKTRQKENADLIKKIEMYDRILQTSERKAVYEINDTSSHYTWRRVMIFLYYSAIVCYIIFGNFIPDKIYLNKSVWLMIVIASVIPIILSIIIKWVFVIGDVLAYWFKERPYKDIFADLNESP